MSLPLQMTKVFRGNSFEVVCGSLHPAYSFDTFEEEGEFKEVYWRPQAGDVVIDVGASYGSYALTACAMGAKVYAFEPEKAVFIDLMRNIVLNGWQERCFAFNRGLWSVRRTIDMKTYAPHWPTATITSDYEMEILDSVVEDLNLPRVDWIKIDVEGAEEHVLLGSLKTIAKFKPRLIIECHTFLDAELAEKIEKLVSSVSHYGWEKVDRPPCVMQIGTRSDL